MDREVNIIDLFSGIGGFTKGLKDAGFKVKKHYFSEINKHAIACYKYHYPEAINLGDILEIKTNNLNEINIITFGSPCQNFSLAGNRKGLQGEKSSLIKEAMRIVRELQPDIFIWENVKGAFSSNNRQDFWAILQAFTNLGTYRLEWQLLNTKWFLPQNRERIYLIGHLDGRSIPRVFPIGENDEIFKSKRKSKPRSSQTQYCTTINPKFGNRATDTFIQIGDFRYDEGLRIRNNNISPTLRRRTGAGASSSPIVIGAFRGRNVQNPSDRTPGKKLKQRLEINKKGICNTLSTVQKDNLVIKIKEATKKGYACASVGDSVDFGFISSKTRRGRVGKGYLKNIDTACNMGVVTEKLNIRRLTEVECERLQGFPDDWTKTGVYEDGIKPISKTQRYNLIGNAVSVDVIEEITRRLLS
ncbi:DNA cytosine methyltransferase [Ornithobacterium rhinotracheale]